MWQCLLEQSPGLGGWGGQGGRGAGGGGGVLFVQGEPPFPEIPTCILGPGLCHVAPFPGRRPVAPAAGAGTPALCKR